MFMQGDRLRQRLHREEGFTLIELLVVIAIIGILLAIAVPSYLGFTARANNADAQANLREAVPSAEAYFSDHGNYTGLSTDAVTGLAFYDSGLSKDVKVVSVNTAGTKYCLSATHGTGNATYFYEGPGGTVNTTDCTTLP
jgi:prepilin-type N-terminal cleavage/methylation domain-containing protein